MFGVNTCLASDDNKAGVGERDDERGRGGSRQNYRAGGRRMNPDRQMSTSSKQSKETDEPSQQMERDSDEASNPTER